VGLLVARLVAEEHRQKADFLAVAAGVGLAAVQTR
jgi:hypothetical protein